MTEVRGLEPNDIAFLFSTYLRGLRHGNSYYESMESDSYYAFQKEVFTRILGHPNTTVRLACLTEERECIVSYVVVLLGSDGPELFWCWTRPAWRLKGLVKQLLHGFNVRTVNNLTTTGAEIVKRKGLTFCPTMIQLSNGGNNE